MIPPTVRATLVVVGVDVSSKSEPVMTSDVASTEIESKFSVTRGTGSMFATTTGVPELRPKELTTAVKFPL